jgi:hypothetical protein
MKNMMMQGLFLFVTIGTVSAFTVRSQSSPNKSRTTCALNLTPNQGSQLVDAYNNAVHAKDGDDNDFVAVGLRPNNQESITAVTTTTTTATGGVSATARALFHRLLSPLSSHAAHDDENYSDDADDVVYYPVVGFTYVPDAKDHSRALPTVSNPSCRLIYEKLLDKQALYGEWKQPEEVVVERKEAKVHDDNPLSLGRDPQALNML